MNGQLHVLASKRDDEMYKYANIVEADLPSIGNLASITAKY